MYNVVLRIVFCAKSIVIFVRSVVLLANPEVRSIIFGSLQRGTGNESLAMATS